MKIVYVLNSGRPGGVEQHVLDLVRGMVRKDHEVFVVCPWGEMVEYYFEAGAAVRIDKPRFDIDPFYIFRLVKFLKGVKPDVFHVHQLKTVVNGLIAAKLCRLGKGPNSSKFGSRARLWGSLEPGPGTSEPNSFPSVPAIIAHIHTPLSEWQVPEWKKRINIFVNRLVTNWAAGAVLALTKTTREVRIREEGIDPEKVVVIPNGVDAAGCVTRYALRGSEFRKNLGISDDVVLVGTLSRLTVEKGIGVLVETIPLVTSYLPALSGVEGLPVTSYVIGGSGELRETLEQQAQDLGLVVIGHSGARSASDEAIESQETLSPPLRRVQSDKEVSSRLRQEADSVCFLGFVPDEEKFAYLSALDIFVFPSLAEGFGISLIEAMACGCACLVSDLPVLREVGGRAVETFKAGDAEDLAGRLVEMINDPERRKSLGDAGKKRVEKEFTMEKFWKRYEELYEGLIWV